MVDIKKLIKALEFCTKPENMTCEGCPYYHINKECQARKDALELLKAQPQPVQCKDCKNSECVGRFGDIVCGRTGTPHRQEWYCPCGEPKDKP